jgi:hypothetical protein
MPGWRFHPGADAPVEAPPCAARRVGLLHLADLRFRGPPGWSWHLFGVTHVTVTSIAASVAVEAGHRPRVSTFGQSLIGRRAERSGVIA